MKLINLVFILVIYLVLIIFKDFSKHIIYTKTNNKINQT